MKPVRGFTLVELLVAMFITAIMFAMGYGALSQAIEHRGSLTEQQTRLVEVQKAMRVIAQDFTQLAPRAMHEPLGDGMQPALLADGRSQGIATFTRAGWSNVAGLPRASLQRVRYSLDQGKLRREYWPVVEPMLATPPRHRDILTGVKTMRLRFYTATRSWSETWPVSQPAANEPSRELPWAVEVTIDLEDYGVLTRLFEVAS